MSIRLFDKICFRSIGTVIVATRLNKQPLTNKVSMRRLCIERYYNVLDVVVITVILKNQNHAKE